VLNDLKHRGYMVVSEVARGIIKEQHAIGGNATHTGNRKIYCDLMLKVSIEDYFKMLPITEEVIFFDRGIPDLYSYSDRFCGGVTSVIKEAVNYYRYNTKVFLFPPWQEIYCHDMERKQDFQEAIETYYAVKEGYTTCGYEVIVMPKESISVRSDFILEQVEQALGKTKT
jgi:predicted ATPase